jgi:hypothetical protein
MKTQRQTLKQTTKLTLSALVLGLCATAQAVTPSITNIRMAAGNPQLRIQGDIGITNQIQCKTDLGEAKWLPVTNAVITRNGVQQVSLARDNGNRCFRLSRP